MTNSERESTASEPGREGSRVSNRDLYEGSEFERWAGAGELQEEELTLVRGHLDPAARTVEAGCGGGRIVLALQRMGFSDLHGFDFVPQLVERARANDPSGAVRFAVGDAAALGYESGAFDQVVYLQQLISTLEDDFQREATIREAYRILRPGGTALFSALFLDTRLADLRYRAFLEYLWLRRRLTGDDRPRQQIPWLRLGERPHLWALLDRGPYTYWYRARELEDLLLSAGFEVRAVGSSREVLAGEMPASAREFAATPAGGLYFVCGR